MIENRDFFGASIQGTRARQEDAWDYLESPSTQEGGANLLAIVADGLGGELAGHVASNLAVESFIDSFNSSEASASQQLEDALHRANEKLSATIQTDKQYEGMGTTVVAVVCFHDRAVWLSIGDSFILRYRDKQLELLNPLHTYGAELDRRVDNGEISEREALSHPDRDLLTSALLGEELAEIATGECEILPDDILLLATDGILTLPVSNMESICSRRADVTASSLVKGLLESVEKEASLTQDNATIIAIRARPTTSLVDDQSLEPNGTRKSSLFRRVFSWRRN